VPLLLDRAVVADMAVRAASVGVRDGTDRTVELVLDAVGRASSSGAATRPADAVPGATTRTNTDLSETS